ncbi:hypothetical protein [Mucilaginibacter sp. FT3.2]|uniref:hypothetical protein n=1 Tax=Mucilaginibacter sp. FT3.2 TaxID=2723090 RepID=UPI00160CCE49|nr:hypothetical protein [Mucilaginibacter sp. FT3.2]MBB6231462.1 hypothetical protein [Mucilaginibacter sp. FT3.2]
MKYVTLLFTALALCSVSSCNKSSSPGPASTSITGSWRWVKPVGGIGGFTLTPQNTGYAFTQVYGADSSFKMYKKDSLQVSGKFSITKNYKYSNTETLNLLKINDQNPTSFMIRNDTLYQNDIFISDGFNTVYVRVRPD